MPGQLSRGDARLLWVAGIVGTVLVAATAFLSPAVQQGNSPIPSSYSPDPDGALAAYLLLGELKFSVLRLEQTPASLADAPVDSILILAEPSQAATGSERKALADFAMRGGRILFCGSSLEDYLPLPATKPMRPGDLRPYEPGIPSPLVSGAEVIRMNPRARWIPGLVEPVALYGKDGEPVIVTVSLGQGEVIWWAAATPLTNTGISQADNLRLFLNLVSRDDHSPRRVYWDEYFHGGQGTLWSYVAKTPLPFGLWQLALVASALLFSFSRRSGPEVSPSLRSRLSPMEFVDTMGDLYHRAGAEPFAVEVPYRRLRVLLARKLGRSLQTADVELVRGAEKRFLLTETELLDVLQQADQAGHSAKLSPKRALDLVQKLASYSNRIAFPQLSQEKKT